MFDQIGEEEEGKVQYERLNEEDESKNLIKNWNSSLTFLNISNNSIGQRGISNLLPCLQSNFSLSHLTLDSNPDGGGGTSLKHICRQLRTVNKVFDEFYLT